MGEDLLPVAEALARLARATSPKQAFLRRAVSTAYYAVFQTLAGRCANAFVTVSGSDAETYVLVYRGLDHASARKAFEARDIEAAFGQDIALLTSLFLDLQQARVSADYIPRGFPFSQAEVEDLIALARDACEIIDNAPLRQMRRLAAQLIIKRR